MGEEGPKSRSSDSRFLFKSSLDAGDDKMSFAQPVRRRQVYRLVVSDWKSEKKHNSDWLKQRRDFIASSN